MENPTNDSIEGEVLAKAVLELRTCSIQNLVGLREIWQLRLSQLSPQHGKGQAYRMNLQTFHRSASLATELQIQI